MSTERVVRAPTTSIWGHVQDSTRLAHGAYSVGTASHGGIMVAVAQGMLLLSDPARERGGGKTGIDGWYVFEEDCDWAIPVFEHPEWGVTLFAWNKDKHPEHVDPAYWVTECWRTLSRWNPDYLMSRGYAPMQPEYDQGCAMRQDMADWQKGKVKA